MESDTNTQSDLTQILDEIERTARDATTGQYQAVKRLADIDVPALVKALRRTERDLKIFGARWTLDDITAILNQGRKD